jgi:hypothetical protein
MTKNPYLEKQSSLLAGTAISHLAQNIATNQALKSKKVAKYLANSFTEGYHGVVNKSFKAKAARSATSVITPDVAAAHTAAHEAGGHLSEVLHGATKRQRAAARMAVEGKFDTLKKLNMHEDPVVKAVHGVLQKHLPTIKNLSDKHLGELSKLWKDKSHPLLSNIAKNIGHGKVPVGSNFVPGKHTQALPLLSAMSVAPIEPGAAILDGAKALAGSKAVQGNKYGKKAVDFLKKTFITNPLKHGAESKVPVGGFKHEAYKYLGNPTSAHLKRTAAAISHATGSST